MTASCRPARAPDRRVGSSWPSGRGAVNGGPGAGNVGSRHGFPPQATRRPPGDRGSPGRPAPARRRSAGCGRPLRRPPGTGSAALRGAGRARRARRTGDREGAGAGARRLPAGAGPPQGARPAGGGDVPAPGVPRKPGHGQDHGGAAPGRDVPGGRPAAEGPPGRGRPGRPGRAVRRRDRDQDRPCDPPGARRRPVHRRGLLAGAGGRRPAGLRARGDRGPAQAHGGPPPPPGGDRGRATRG